jgi:hypothetical protein
MADDTGFRNVKPLGMLGRRRQEMEDAERAIEEQRSPRPERSPSREPERGSDEWERRRMRDFERDTSDRRR